MTPEIVSTVAVIGMFTTTVFCIRCLFSLQRQMEKRVQSLVILLRSQNIEDGVEGIERISDIEKREAKESLLKKTKIEVTPEEEDLALVNDAEKAYESEDLDKSFT